MSNLNLVTGHRGVGHVTAEDHGSFQAAIFGTGSYVLDRGNKFAASVITNNQIRIADGDLLQQGRHTRLKEGTYIDLTIENGEQARNRSDLIVCRYTKDSVTGVEESNMIVIKGEPAAGTPADPAHVEGDIINDHVYIADMLMFRVSLEGLNITGIVPLFTVKSINDPSIISDAWNDTDTYAVGEYRIDENALYKCLITNSGQKPSTSPTYWAATSVTDEIDAINTDHITSNWSEAFNKCQREIIAIVTATVGNQNQMYYFVIPKNIITSTDRVINQGFYLNANTYALCQIGFRTSYCTVSAYIVNGVSYNADISFHYR